MIYGYARVSTQDESGQAAQLTAAGCEKVFREKITGTTADRPQHHVVILEQNCGTEKQNPFRALGFFQRS